MSAKIAIDRLDLQTFHQDLEKHMARVFGREIGILNEATKEGNKSIDELKRGAAKAQLDSLHEQSNSMEVQLDAKDKALRNKVIELDNLENKIGGLDDELKEKQKQIKTISGTILTVKQIEKIQPKKSLVGGAITGEGVTVECIENLKRTAMPNATSEEEKKKALAEIRTLKKSIKELQGKVKELEALAPKPKSILEKAGEILVQKFAEIPDKDKLEIMNAYEAKINGRTINRNRSHDPLQV